jgi:hypothetical protein
LVEAPDPLGMVPTSTMNISEVFQIIHRLWMGRWIHHHATSTIYALPEAREFMELLDLGSTTNNDKVYWLRPQTHLDWFPHPLQTYAR